MSFVLLLQSAQTEFIYYLIDIYSSENYTSMNWQTVNLNDFLILRRESIAEVKSKKLHQKNAN